VNPALHSQLRALHGQLQHLSSLDGETRDLLVTVLADITALLAKDQAPARQEESVAERFEQLAVRFEADHPALGTAMRQVVDLLAKAGI